MLVKATKDMVYRNALVKAGSVFEYDGKACPVTCEPVAVAKPAEPRKRSVSSSTDKSDD